MKATCSKGRLPVDQERSEEGTTAFHSKCEYSSVVERLQQDVNHIKEVLQGRLSNESEDIKDVPAKIDQLIEENKKAQTIIYNLTLENNELKERLKKSEEKMSSILQVQDQQLAYPHPDIHNQTAQSPQRYDDCTSPQDRPLCHSAISHASASVITGHCTKQDSSTQFQVRVLKMADSRNHDDGGEKSDYTYALAPTWGSFNEPSEMASLIQPCVEDSCQHAQPDLFHCPLCPVNKFKPARRSKVKSHLQAHWKTYVYCESTKRYAVVCHLQHDGYALKKSRHYHCPLCGKIIVRKSNLEQHLKGLCSATARHQQASNNANSTRACSATLSDHLYAGSLSATSKTPACQTKKSRETCFICGHSVTKKWMPYHKKLHSNKGEITSSRHHHTVDTKHSIYCSEVDLKGLGAPVHVREVTCGPGAAIQYEHPSCDQSQEVA